MIEAGLLTKLPKLNSKSNLSTKQSLTPLLLSLSSLPKSQFPIPSLPILSLLLPILRSPSPPADPTILPSAAAALRNLSTQLDNCKPIISAGAIHLLLRLCFLRSEAAEAALSTLANLALTEEGRKAIEEDSLVPDVLVNVMGNGEEEEKCRELAGYLLMVVAGRSAEKRRRMLELGVVEMLMEIGLIGRSRIVRERAIRMLGWFRDGRNGDVKRCGREIRCLVKLSLDRNMESILKRSGGEKKIKKNCWV